MFISVNIPTMNAAVNVDEFPYLNDHGGTTEEGNCSYLLPCAAAAGSKGTNKG